MKKYTLDKDGWALLQDNRQLDCIHGRSTPVERQQYPCNSQCAAFEIMEHKAFPGGTNPEGTFAPRDAFSEVLLNCCNRLILLAPKPDDGEKGER